MIAHVERQSESEGNAPVVAALLVLFGKQLAAALGVASNSAALRIVKRDAIPFVRVGRRIGVRVAALEAWFREREERTQARPTPPPVPAAPPWARELLRRGRRPGIDGDAARRGGGR